MTCYRGDKRLLAKIYVMLKKSVLDPQGKAVQHSLDSLGYSEVKDVRLGKYIEIKFDHAEGGGAEARVREMCERLLANTVIEDYSFEIIDE